MTNHPSDLSSTEYLQRPGGRIAYDRSGSGPLIVLAPGMGNLRSTYRFIVSPLVAAGFEVVTTDLRGHGDSDATFRAYGDEETADDLLALIDSLGKPAVIVGNSMAAGAGVIAAARRPEHVAGLALLGPFVRQPPVNRAMRVLMRVLMAPPWAAAVWRAYLPSLYAGTRPADFDSHRALITQALRRPGHAAAFSATTRTDHSPAEAALPAVAAPTIVVMGADDPDFADPAAEARWIANELGGRSILIPDAGHYPQSQQPAATVEALLPFLATLPDRA